MSITQRALAEAVLLGAACGPLGLWVLAFRQAYAAESTAHAMLPGLALAAVAGLPLLLGAAGGVLAAAALVALAARDTRIGGELAVAVTITALFGAGVLLASGPSADDAPQRLTDLLFGDLLGVTDGDLLAAALLLVTVAGALVLGHRALTAAAHDPASARSLGGPGAAATQAGLLVLLGLALVVAVQGLGNLLVVALLIAPAAAAQRLAPRLTHRLALAAALGAASGALGVAASDRLSLAAGASVALTACLLALVTLAVRRGDGDGGAGAGAARPSPLASLASRG